MPGPLLRSTIVASIGFACWLAAEQTASAQTRLPVLLAQSGGAKTAIGWLLVLLCLLLALLAICWPAKRKWPDAK
jgi:hypothetical protein